MKRKIIAMLLVLTMAVCAFPMSAFAEDDLSGLSHIGLTDDHDDGIMPYVNTPCTGGNGKCQMMSSGLGFLWDVNNQKYILAGVACWQCKNCLTVMITEGEPPCGQAIGRYCIWPCNYVINKNGCVLYVTEDMVCYTSSSSLEGYQFMYV